MRDRETFDAFYRATVRRVVKHAYVVCGDLAEAQDAAQEAYARAWQKWSHISRYDDPEGWVRTVAWRLLANRWRKSRRWVAARLRLGPAVPAREPTVDTVAIVAALRKLPPAQRQAVVLHYLCDLSVDQVAAALNAPVGTVKTRLFRARAALAELLTDDTEELKHVS